MDMTFSRPRCILLLAAMTTLLVVKSQGADLEPKQPNYDEAKVPAYTLPDPLTFNDGKPVTKSRQWKKRREEILRLFEENEYGRMPGAPKHVRYEFRSVDKTALNGLATRKEIVISLTDKRDGPTIELLVYIPNQRKGRAPAFLMPNFYGNHSITTDPGVTLSKKWMRNSKDFGVVNNRATEASRGVRASRWPVEMILEHGYALATFYYGDLEPDYPEGWKDGIRGALQEPGKEFAADDWGAIGAWAWGLSRAMDYLEKDGDIDDHEVAVMGHSRLGKTALWAGATDERFAIVISNDSGCGGAAISRRAFGETVAKINKSFPHWFCGNFKQYGNNEAALPVDQHELIALAAPRPVYVASAELDNWSDQRGEFLSCLSAGAVYELLGRTGLGVVEMPGIDQPVGDYIGYHIRTGKHDVTDFDWEQYMKFADRHYGIKRKQQ